MPLATISAKPSRLSELSKTWAVKANAKDDTIICNARYLEVGIYPDTNRAGSAAREINDRNQCGGTRRSAPDRLTHHARVVATPH